uniref:Uncharacterized protein n=1 Tax=Heliothis virescens TaxID=7102 RepID=A0A2A4J5H8_HELVI
MKKFTKTPSPNPKLRTLDKRISSDEILIKRHIQEKDLPSSLIFKITKSVASSTSDLDQKWPVVELLSESDDFKQYLDEFDNKQFHFFHDVESKSKTTEFPQNNNSKDKAVGLRSLPGVHCEDGDQCVCMLPTKTGAPKTTTSKLTTSFPNGLGFGIGIPPMGIPMGFPIGMPAGYPAGIPAAIPAGIPVGVPASFQVPCPAGIPHPYYPPSVTNEDPITKKPCHKKHRTSHKKDNYKLQSEDNLYYEEEEEPQRIDMYDEYDMNIIKKRKHTKQHRDYYDIFEEKRDKKPHQNSKLLNKPKELLKDPCNDLDKKCDDTVIKNCYCCSASFHSVNKVVLILLIFLAFC